MEFYPVSAFQPCKGGALGCIRAPRNRIKNCDFSWQITCWFVQKLKGKNVSSIICYHTSQSLVSQYPISKWNLSLRILTRIEIHNIIIEKNLFRSIIKFFSSIFRVGKCFSQFWGKKSRKFGLGLGPNFFPKLSPPPPPKKKPTKNHWHIPLLFLNIGVQW